MSDFDLSSYKPLYLQTARNYIRDIRDAVGMLQQQNTDKDAIKKIYISAHSLKSQSILMGYNQVGNLCMKIELYFKPLKEQGGSVPQPVIEVLQKIVTEFTATMDTIESENKERDLSSISSAWETI